MELYQQMIISGLVSGELSVTLNEKTQKWLEARCYRALQKIQAIVADDSLDDTQCFMKVEEIIQVLEETGGSGGGRHDFG